MFDVELELCVYLSLTPGVFAYMDVRVLGQSPAEGGRARWRVVGRHDKRLPNVGGRWHEASWATDGLKPMLVLETRNKHSWVKLEFPAEPTLNSSGVGHAYNLPVGPARYKRDGTGSYHARWAVRRKGENRVLYDPGELRGTWQNLKQPTGWTYETSAGASATGGSPIFVGGGAGTGHFIFTRTSGGHAEKLRVDYNMGAIGAMLPGAGAGGSTEDFPSYGTRVFAPAARATGNFRPQDFAGGITAVDLGVGGGHGAYDWYVFMLTDGIFKTCLPNPVAVKAFFYCRGLSAGTGSTESAQLLLWAGSATVKSYKR